MSGAFQRLRGALDLAKRLVEEIHYKDPNNFISLAFVFILQNFILMKNEHRRVVILQIA